MIRSTTPLDDFSDCQRAPRVVPPRGLGREYQPTVSIPPKPREPKQARLDRQAAEMRERNQAPIRKRTRALGQKRGPNGWRFAKAEKS